MGYLQDISIILHMLTLSYELPTFNIDNDLESILPFLKSFITPAILGSNIAYGRKISSYEFYNPSVAAS